VAGTGRSALPGVRLRGFPRGPGQIRSEPFHDLGVQPDRQAPRSRDYRPTRDCQDRYRRSCRASARVTVTAAVENNAAVAADVVSRVHELAVRLATGVAWILANDTVTAPSRHRGEASQTKINQHDSVDLPANDRSQTMCADIIIR
jgi:hypothetical protein